MNAREIGAVSTFQRFSFQHLFKDWRTIVIAPNQWLLSLGEEYCTCIRDAAIDVINTIEFIAITGTAPASCSLGWIKLPWRQLKLKNMASAIYYWLCCAILTVAFTLRLHIIDKFLFIGNRLQIIKMKINIRKILLRTAPYKSDIRLKPI